MSWTKHFSQSKQKHYWFNKDTGESSWFDPTEKEDKSNHVWKKHFSKKYQKDFWFNSITGKSSWENPNDPIIYSTNIKNEEKLMSNSSKKSILSPEPVTDSTKLRNDRIRRLLIERVRRKKKEAELKESLSESLEKLNIKDNNEKDNKDKDKKEKDNSIKLKKPIQKQSSSHSSTTKTIEIQNSMGIYHSFDAPSHWDSEDIREHIRDISQSMNPYD